MLGRLAPVLSCGTRRGQLPSPVIASFSGCGDRSMRMAGGLVAFNNRGGVGPTHASHIRRQEPWMALRSYIESVRSLFEETFAMPSRAAVAVRSHHMALDDWSATGEVHRLCWSWHLSPEGTGIGGAGIAGTEPALLAEAWTLSRRLWRGARSAPAWHRPLHGHLLHWIWRRRNSRVAIRQRKSEC